MNPSIPLFALVVALTLVTNGNGCIESRLDAAAVPTSRDWIPAADQAAVKRDGEWQERRFRYASAIHLLTHSDRAALEYRFRGTGIAVRLGNHAVPSYGTPNLGRIVVSVDGKTLMTIHPSAEPREIVVARGLDDSEHLLRVEHRSSGGGTGCRVESFQASTEQTGELSFNLSGEESAFLVDVRAVLSRGGRIIRNTLVRNWMTGQCRLVGLPPGEGYTLELFAVGWNPARIDDVSIGADRTTKLTPIFLDRNDATRVVDFRFPRLNQPAIRKPGQLFRARFLGFDSVIEAVFLQRTVGPAVFSRRLNFEDDPAAAFYYDREVAALLPDDIPPGFYDLSVQLTGGRSARICRSPRSVHVVRSFPTDPVFVTFGHLDTSGQHQAEYLERLVSMINILAPDMVLVSNAVNPAYVSGALSKLEMPYVINFGNHQFPGHEKWYGDPVGMIDFGPDVSVLNFGHPWHVDRSKAESLLASRTSRRCKIINSFEQNAPITLLDKHQIRMSHDAHGTGVKVMDMGATPTRRVGKVNASSFRVVRFRDNRVEDCTYNGDIIAPIPFGRSQSPSPLRVQYSPANDGTNRSVTAKVTNEYLEDFPRCRLTLFMPKGQYTMDHGLIESSTDSDDKQFTVLAVRVDVTAQKTTTVQVKPIAP